MDDRRARRRWVGGALVAVLLLVAVDQWSKGVVCSRLSARPPEVVIDDHGHARILLVGQWLAFNSSCNPGAAFGHFGDYSEVLVGGRILAVAFLLWFLVRGDLRQRSVLVAVALVLAGATGNLIDNLWTGCDPRVLGGCATAAGDVGRPFGVRDFIDVWFEPILGRDYHFPSFNVADSCISVGACLWVLSGLFHRRQPDEDAERDGTDGAVPAA